MPRVSTRPFKLARGRLSETGDDLMSRPTLSRLENAPPWRELARMGLSLIDLFCSSFKTVPHRPRYRRYSRRRPSRPAVGDVQRPS
jgi:hypothetical protein